MDAATDAVQRADETGLRLLLRKHGPNLDWSNSTLLHEAARRGHHSIVHLLIGQVPELKIDAVDNNGWTALHVAAFEGHYEVVDVLIRQVAVYSRKIFVEMRTCDTLNLTALELAVQQGHIAVELLLVLTDCIAETTSDTRCDKLRLLLLRSPQLAQTHVDLAMQRAIDADNDEIVKVLVGVNPKLITTHGLCKAIEHGRDRAALAMVNEYERLHGSDRMGELLSAGRFSMAPLYCAVQHRLHVLTLRLFEFQCNQFYIGSDGSTMLHCAVNYWGIRNPSQEVVKRLLELDPSAARAVDVVGNTPFVIAARIFPRTHWLVELLRLKVSFDDIKQHPDYARRMCPL